MYPNYYCYCHKSERYSEINSKKYRLVIMDAEGKTTFGACIYDSLEEMNEAMAEVRDVLTKYGINSHVGYMEVG